MTRLLPALLAFAPAVAPAQDEPASPLSRKIPAMSVLPPGSVLQGVTLPQYDAERRLTSVLDAKTITLLSTERLEGETLVVELFDEAGTTRGRIELAKAQFDQRSGILTSNEQVEIGPFPSGENHITASGAGLLFDLETNQAYLIGPTLTRIRPQPATAMNIKPLQAATLLAAATLPAATGQAPPPPTGTEAPTAAEVAEAQEQTREALRSDLAQSAAASRTVADFLDRTASETIQAPAPAPRHEPDQEPAEAPRTGTETVIHSADGLYLDAAEGVLAYLGNVRVENPRIELSGANELKVFFEKKPEAEPAEAEPDDAALGGAFGDLGEPQRLMATGAVKVRLIPENGEPVEASGAVLSYDIATEQIVIQGGYPWVVQKGFGSFRAQQPNLILRVNLGTGDVVTEGHWENMLENLDQR